MGRFGANYLLPTQEVGVFWLSAHISHDLLVGVVAVPHEVIHVERWCMLGLCATAGVAGEAGPGCAAGHRIASGARGCVIQR